MARPLSRLDRAVYGATRLAIVGLAKVLFRVRVTGAAHIPRTGACILAPVHRSNLDTPILGCVTARRLRFMGKDSLWRNRALGWYLSTLGGFPVARGTADREALRACQVVLERGEPLVMFPEGTRRSGEVIGEIFDGPAFVAARTGAPIVPIGIGGSERVMPKGARMIRPRRVVIKVGAPIRPPDPSGPGRLPRRAVRELSEELHRELQALFDEVQLAAGAREGT